MNLRDRLCALVLVAAGCASHVPPPAEPGPTLERPSAAIPADLDLAIRIDLDGLRRVLGPDVARAIEIGIVDPEKDPVTAGLVKDAFSSATTVWVAVRPGSSARLTDNVIALRGDFAHFDPGAVPNTPWVAPADLGAGFQVYSRPRPARRSSPSRIYVKAGDWVVFVSEAEVDSARRAIEEHAADERVEPPDRGLVSFAVRAEPIVPLLAERFSAVADTLRGATLVDADADADERGLKATLEVRFTNESDAEQAKERAMAVVDALHKSEGPFGTLARGATTSVVGPSLVIRVELAAKEFGELVSDLGALESR